MEQGSEDRMLKQSTTRATRKKTKPTAPASTPRRFACERCGSEKSYVVNTWPSSRDEMRKVGQQDDGEHIMERVVVHLVRRKRCCQDCGGLFFTDETVAEPLRRRKGKTPQ